MNRKRISNVIYLPLAAFFLLIHAIKRKHILKIILPLAIILILIAAAIYLSSYISQDSIGSISYPKISETNQNVSMMPTQYSGTYATFNYPKSLSVYPSSKTSPPVLANYSFINRDAEQWFLTITILNISGGSLESDNAYQTRALNPKEYLLSVVKTNNENVPVMTDSLASGYDKVAFLSTAKYQATVSLTADYLTDPNLDKALDMVLSSWQWH